MSPDQQHEFEITCSCKEKKYLLLIQAHKSYEGDSGGIQFMEK